MGIIHMRILNGKKEEKKIIGNQFFFLFLQSKPYYYSRIFLWLWLFYQAIHSYSE